MADFSILIEMVPSLSSQSNESLSKIWRDWMNSPAQDDMRHWLTRPLSVEERSEIQSRFKADWESVNVNPLTMADVEAIKQDVSNGS